MFSLISHPDPIWPPAGCCLRLPRNRQGIATPGRIKQK
jgi:hypothetical protein